MTQKDYNDLWVEFGKAKPKCSIPGYRDYLKSENMFEDYLDIFRGKNTRSKRSKGLTDRYDEHPFFDGDKPKLENKPCIKYVMIGEARPESKPVNKNSCGADKNNTYFYNVNHRKHTNWLKEPFLAFYPTRNWVGPDCPQDKIDVLLQLASAGYVLIDLFPFSFNFSRDRDLRNRLNSSGVSSYFFNHYLTPKLNQIVRIQNEYQGEKQKPRIAFSGPATTHHFLIHEIISGRLILPVGYTMFRTVNHFGVAAPPNPVALPKKITPWLPIANRLNGNYANVKFNCAPFYRAGCWDGSFVSGPRSLFIRNAFDLP